MTDHSGLIVLATDWGFEGDAAALTTYALESGYDGIEPRWPIGDPARQAAIVEATQAQRAVLALLVSADYADLETHLASIDEQLDQIVASGATVLHVNLHAGRDFDLESSDRLAAWIVEARRRTGLDLLLENHRTRPTFAAPLAAGLLQRHPDLRMTLDISHWLVVHESTLDEFSPYVDLAIERSDHVHARVGHPEGPQINDPLAPEWAGMIERHFGWWDRVVERRHAEGRPATFMCEFGPVDYAPAEPVTRRPHRSHFESNLWMLEQLRARYA